ncbi:MAG: hypothetical protein KGJ32_02615 [Xanthomonadaceae bacterium]|nr:hypothetical protein [Xanthomonadaceae bacterium]
MPDLVVQNVDSQLVARIKSLARDRHCSINDVLLYALRHSLGVSAAEEYSETLCDSQALTLLDDHWGAEERGVFQEALDALARTRPTQWAPENIRDDGT